MTRDEILQRIKKIYEDADIYLEDASGDHSKLHLEVKTSAFKDLSRIKQHQAVMALFQNELQSGEVHAISLKTASL